MFEKTELATKSPPKLYLQSTAYAYAALATLLVAVASVISLLRVQIEETILVIASALLELLVFIGKVFYSLGEWNIPLVLTIISVILFFRAVVARDEELTYAREIRREEEKENQAMATAVEIMNPEPSPHLHPKPIPRSRCNFCGVWNDELHASFCIHAPRSYTEFWLWK